jgi:hypothetical protein
MKKDTKPVVDDSANYGSSSKNISDVFDSLFYEDEEEDDPATSYPSSWKFPNNPNSPISHSFSKPAMPATPIDVSGAVQPELTRKPNVFNISFDVTIGNPQRSSQKIWIANSQGKSVYLSHYRHVIQLSLELFNNNIRAAHHNGLPRFTIYSGNSSTMPEAKDVELIFYGLYFDDTKIKASFIYYNEALMPNQDVMELLSEIERTCHFFIVGEFEMDDSEDNIIGMEIESFDYVNPCRLDIVGTKKMLYKVR